MAPEFAASFRPVQYSLPPGEDSTGGITNQTANIVMLTAEMRLTL
jgi:hypothetical protein